MSKSILVTGPAGFIGSNFVKVFKKQYPEYEIIGIDNFSTGKRELLDKDIIFYEGSIVDMDLLEKIFKNHRPEYVVNFAAIPSVIYSVKYPADATLNNIFGTVALLEKSRDYGVKRFVHSSSSAVYGDAKKIPTKEKENIPQPVSPYGLQKFVDELFCKMFSDLYNLDTVCLRYFNVFGPGQYGDSPYSTVICAWLESLYFPQKDKKPFLEGDGKQSRDFCYVDNIVNANIKAIFSKINFNGEVFNIGGGKRINLLSIKKIIEKYTNKKLDLEKRPRRIGDVYHTQADISKAKKLLGYKPIINFEEGLKKTIKWFKERAL